MTQPSFLRLASISAFLTVLTTIGVHFVDFQAETFEERLLLARHAGYLAQKWMIVLHCLLVIVSMFGVAVLAAKTNVGLAATGALFIAVFGVAEITRMLSVFSYLNPLKEKYMAASDPAVRQVIQLQIESFGMAATTLFLLFILAFALGNFFLGLAMAKNQGLDKWIAWMLLIWAGLTLLAFGNHFWQNPTLGAVLEFNGKFLQPLFRLAIAGWLFQKARQAVMVTPSLI